MGVEPIRVASSLSIVQIFDQSLGTNSSFSRITIETGCLKSLWVAVLSQPSISLIASRNTALSSVRGSIILDMVDGQE